MTQQTDYPVEFQKYATQYNNRIEVIGAPIYDTVQYPAAGVVRLAFFTAVRATIDLSNMRTAGQLAPPYAFLIRAIRVIYKQRPESLNVIAAPNVYLGAGSNIELLGDNGVLTLTIGSKVYGEFPLWAIPAGGGAYGQIATYNVLAAGAGVDAAGNGYPFAKNVLTLSKPIFINPELHFRVDLEWPGVALPPVVTRNVMICVALDGDLVRPVQ
jgi:hypothetical protein